ncbi:hypothetical protein D3C71_1794720 [compost metagenome]
MERRLATAALVTPSAHRPEASSTVAVIRCRPGFKANVTVSAVLRWAAIFSSTMTPTAHIPLIAPISRVTTTLPVEGP